MKKLSISLTTGILFSLVFFVSPLYVFAGDYDSTLHFSCSPQRLSQASSTWQLSDAFIVDGGTYNFSYHSNVLDNCTFMAGWDRSSIYPNLTTPVSPTVLLPLYHYEGLFRGTVGSSSLLWLYADVNQTTLQNAIQSSTITFSPTSSRFFFAVWDLQGTSTATSGNTVYNYLTTGSANASSNYGVLNWTYSSSTPPSGNGDLTVLYPVNGSLVFDFSNWSAQVNFYNTSSITRFLTFDYATATSRFASSTTFVNTQVLNGNKTGSYRVDVRKSKQLAPTNLPVLWYYRASLYEGRTLLDQSDILSFEVTWQGTFALGLDAGLQDEALITNISIDCVANYSVPFWNTGSSTFEVVRCLGRELIVFGIEALFKPTDYSVTDFKRSVDNFKTTFPFNVVTVLSDSIADTTDNPATSTNSLTIPFQWGGSFVAFNSSSLSSVIGTDNKNLYFSTLRSFLWVFTGFIMLSLL